MSKKVSIFFLGLVAFFIFQSCDSNSIYSEKKNIPTTWTHLDTISFRYVINDTVSKHDLILTVAHHILFPYENLYVLVNTSFPDGKATKQLLSLQLTSSDNSWMSKCSGEHCTLAIPISSDIKFKLPGEYALNIVQNSRKDTLVGIESLQLDITKSVDK
ncbi:MAG: gliding motility lipoprotein GldH [Saprospiraceae bacterium]